MKRCKKGALVLTHSETVFSGRSCRKQIVRVLTIEIRQVGLACGSRLPPLSWLIVPGKLSASNRGVARLVPPIKKPLNEGYVRSVMRIPRGDRVVTIHHVIRAAHLPVCQEGAGPDRWDLFELSGCASHCLLNVYSIGTIYGLKLETQIDSSIAVLRHMFVSAWNTI